MISTPILKNSSVKLVPFRDHGDRDYLCRLADENPYKKCPAASVWLILLALGDRFWRAVTADTGTPVGVVYTMSDPVHGYSVHGYRDKASKGDAFSRAVAEVVMYMIHHVSSRLMTGMDSRNRGMKILFKRLGFSDETILGEFTYLTKGN